MTAKTFDSKCHELAEHFAQDEAPPLSSFEIDDLAAHIQTAVEDWLEMRDRSRLPE